MRSSKIVPWLCALCASLAFTPETIAQVPSGYPPGASLHYKITLTGDGASKVACASLFFALQGSAPQDQNEGFTRTIMDSAQICKKIAPGVFDVTVGILANNASGTYVLQGISTRNDGSFVTPGRLGLFDWSPVSKNRGE